MTNRHIGANLGPIDGQYGSKWTNMELIGTKMESVLMSGLQIANAGTAGTNMGPVGTNIGSVDI